MDPQDVVRMGANECPHVGRLVRGFRQRAGLTQQQAAERAGISAAAVRDLEQGRVSKPRPVTLRRLAGALALSDSEADQLVQATQPGSSSWVKVQMLGPLLITVNGQPVDPGSAIQRALLGSLALAANMPVTRDVLIDVAWGPQPPATSSDLLQTHISRLRRRLQPRRSAAALAPALVATSGGYQLTVSDDQLDMLTFRRLIAEAKQARAAGDLVGAYELSQRAALLWRSEPLADVPTLHAHPAAVALTHEWQTLVVEHAEIATDLGRHDEVLPHLRRLISADPLHEAAHAQLMIALAGTGQQAAALDIFHRLRCHLAEELGTDPGPEIIRAHERVLRQEIARPDIRPSSALRQLPHDLSDFTGRQAELARLHERLPSAESTGTAVVIAAIQGMAGVGKTRLAVHFAHQLVAAGRYTDIQLYVDLRGRAKQPPADPAAVLASFLEQLGVPNSQIPHALDARAALYRERLHGARALVILDNAADEGQLRPLLPAGPATLVLITSRRALALDGATTHALDVFTQSEAESLLERIAGTERVVGDPAATQRVIESCGRLPLAIALAARRLQNRPLWRVADLAARLDATNDRLGELTAGSRQLRTVFDHSYQALPSDVAATFRVLAVRCEDDFTTDALAALIGSSPTTARRHLDQLVDEHLVVMSGRDRYRLHVLLRDYARTEPTGAFTTLRGGARSPRRSAGQ